MFGLLRTTLAIMVMAYHLFWGILPLGTYAVFDFYIISGYLMTLIMHENYGYTLVGRYSFAINRFLRLYPQYWAALIFSIILIYSFDTTAVTNYHGSMFLPALYKDYISNLFMVFPSWSPISINPRLVPPTWALTIEIFFYFLICLRISRTFKRVKIWFLMSICYVAGTFIGGLPWNDRYFTVAAASLPFSIGSAIYFISKNNKVYARHLKLRISSAFLFIIMLVNCLAWVILSSLKAGKIVEIGFYLNLLICSLLVYSLVKGEKIVKINRPIDKRIGDFSYPIYLLHWQCGLLASFIIFGERFQGFPAREPVSVAVLLLFVFLFSFFSILFIDGPVQQIRERIKNNEALQRL